jgi:ABC-type spermidine/putrescine transport system permease subunit II
VTSTTKLPRRSGGTDIGMSVLYALVFLVVVALVAMPVGALVYGSLRTSAPGLPGEWTLEKYAGLLSPGVSASWRRLWSSALRQRSSPSSSARRSH